MWLVVHLLALKTVNRLSRLCSYHMRVITIKYLPLLANYLSHVCAQQDSGTAASVTQLRLHGTPFPKIYMIAQSLCWVSRVCWRHICFVPSLTVAERRALLSLHLHFVAQYTFFVIIVIVSFWAFLSWRFLPQASTMEVLTKPLVSQDKKLYFVLLWWRSIVYLMYFFHNLIYFLVIKIYD